MKLKSDEVNIGDLVMWRYAYDFHERKIQFIGNGIKDDYFDFVFKVIYGITMPNKDKVGIKYVQNNPDEFDKLSSAKIKEYKLWKLK